MPTVVQRTTVLDTDKFPLTRHRRKRERPHISESKPSEQDTPKTKTQAADEVLGLPELVTSIMLMLDSTNLQKARRVSKLWNAQFLASTPMRMIGVLMPTVALMSQPSSLDANIDETIPIYNLAAGIVMHPFFDPYMMTSGRLRSDLHDIDGDQLKWLQKSGSHDLGDAFFTSPACRAIALETWSGSVWDNHLGCGSKQLAIIYVPTGVTVSDVIRVMMKLKKQACVKVITSKKTGYKTDAWRAVATLKVMGIDG